MKEIDSMATPVTGAGNFVSTLPKYEDLKKAAKNPAQSEEMGQQAFLTLFTTQLQNQDPLDPVKNEAFVAQLAQFSQLEATTKMADSLSAMATSMNSERLLSGTGLIGKKVAAPNGTAELLNGANIKGVVSLPKGACLPLGLLGANGSSSMGLKTATAASILSRRR